MDSKMASKLDSKLISYLESKMVSNLDSKTASNLDSIMASNLDSKMASKLTSKMAHYLDRSPKELFGQAPGVFPFLLLFHVQPAEADSSLVYTVQLFKLVSKLLVLPPESQC
jgi:hypothetical protein